MRACLADIVGKVKQLLIPRSPGEKWETAWLASPLAALVVGAGLRLWYYFLNDSFWRDETKLLLNVAQKSFIALLGPLDYQQEAPIPQLWLYRLLYLAGAGGELPIRAFSLTTSILALYLFYCLAQKVLADRRAVLFSTWLLVLAPGVIIFAAMAKSYSLDLLVAAGLLYLAAIWFTNAEGPHRVSPLAWAAGLAPWFSVPSVFVAGAIGAGLLARGRQVRRAALILLAVVALSFTLEWFLVLKRCLRWKNLVEFGFIPLSRDGFEWAYYQSLFAYLGPQGNLSYLGQRAVFILGLLGIWEARQRYGWGWATVLVLPFLLVLGASAAHLFPILGRYILFLTPGFYLLVGYGAALVLRKIPWPRIFVVVLILLALPCLYRSLTTYGRPQGGIREALQYIEARRRPQDLVFGDTRAAPSMFYYRLLNRPFAVSLTYGLDPEEWIEGRVDQNHERLLEPLVLLVLRQRRGWLVAETQGYARGEKVGVHPQWETLMERLGREGQLLDSYITERVQLRAFTPNSP